MDLHVIDVALACQLSAAQLPVWPFQNIAGTMCMTMLVNTCQIQQAIHAAQHNCRWEASMRISQTQYAMSCTREGI
jgi:hypothetical protein